MIENQKSSKGIHLDKWFLDIVTEEGEAMVFYAAKLKWHGIEVPYTSWLHNDPVKGVSIRSRFRKVQMPEKSGSWITWKDPHYEVEGEWMALAAPLHARTYESEEGHLDWNCFQPRSEVKLKIQGKEVKGLGYAEQLVLTAEPWKIPINDLRWGRYGSKEDYMVWIEMRGEEQQQWLWYNGEKIENTQIEDAHIAIPEKGIVLDLDQSVVLESEKKVLQVVKDLIKFLPGINKSMPMQFLMAEEHKWLSRGVLKKGGQPASTGCAIHEWVNFNLLSG